MNHMVTAFAVLGLAAVYVLAAPSIDQRNGEADVLLDEDLLQSTQDNLEDNDLDENGEQNSIPVELWDPANADLLLPVEEASPTLIEENKTNSGEKKTIPLEQWSPENGVISDAASATGGRGRPWGNFRSSFPLRRCGHC